MKNYSLVFHLLVLCSIVVTSALWLEEDEEPINLRAFRVMPNKLDSFDGSRRLLKRGNSIFTKRRGRELFGKRSLPFEYADDSVILESRFRRRANELFG